MSYQYAGMYGPETVLDQTSKLAASTSVTVYNHGTSTLAQLYAPAVVSGIQTLPVPLTSSYYTTNPVSTDTLGNLVFWAAPGTYDLSFSIQGVATTKTVVVKADPAESGLIMPVFRAWYSGGHSYPSGISQVVFNTVIEDNYNGFNASNNNYYAPSAGLYLVHAEWKPNGDVSGTSYMWLQLNGNQVNQSGNWYLTGGGYQSMVTQKLIRCNANDYIQAAINLGSAQSNVLDYFPSTFIDIVKVAD